MIDFLFCKKIPNAVQISITSRAGCSLVLETMLAQSQRVKLALHAHGAHLFPAFHRPPGRIAIGVAMKEERWSGLEIEGKLRIDDVTIIVASRRILSIRSVGEHVGRIVIASAADQNHAGAVTQGFGRRVEPFKIGQTMLVGIEILLADHVSHGGDLVFASIGYLPLGS